LLIEVLAFDGCPNVDETDQRILRALTDERCAAEIVRRDIATAGEAVALRFRGSPSVRINGRDVEVEMSEDATLYGLACRTYRTGDAVEGAPSLASIRRAIRRERVRSKPV
jgi:hypothetical protein